MNHSSTTPPPFSNLNHAPWKFSCFSHARIRLSHLQATVPAG